LPSAPKITRILKDSKGVERDYHHYQIPFLLAREEIINKIRNTKYRYMTGSSTIPTEVDTYDPYIIREALNNCIAHQDYRLGRRIIVVENENFLVFSNAGSFIPETIENVLQENSPSDEYRNEFLATAMVKLGLIDTMGSGIRKMFLTQQKRLFPLPDYKISKDRVIVVLTGEILDMNYARKLEQHPNLSLSEVILLDKLQKKHKLTGEELEILKNKKLIDENTSDITFPDTTSQKQKLGYIEPQKSKDERYKQIILEYIDKFGSISKEDINKLLMDELPVTLSERQKQSKINNIIYSMSRKDKSITNYGTIRYPRWEKN
jgi:ATP-dependent DNA helicase RecG